jgi:hypothetical protein
MAQKRFVYCLSDMGGFDLFEIVRDVKGGWIVRGESCDFFVRDEPYKY